MNVETLAHWGFHAILYMLWLLSDYRTPSTFLQIPLNYYLDNINIQLLQLSPLQFPGTSLLQP